MILINGGARPALGQFVDLTATSGLPIPIPVGDLTTQPLAEADFPVQVTVTPVELRDAPITIRAQILDDMGNTLVSMETVVGPLFRGNQATVPYRAFRQHTLDRSAPVLQEATQQGGLLPPGPYSFVVDAVFQGRTVATAQTPFRLLAADTGIDLAGPGSRAGSPLPTVYSDLPVFTWFGVADRYDIAIYDMPSGASLADEAIANQLPIHRETGIETTTWGYPLGAEPLQPGETYAWQITAQTGFSDTGAFIRQQSPVYRFRMRKDLTERALPSPMAPGTGRQTLAIDGPDAAVRSGQRVSFRAVLADAMDAARADYADGEWADTEWVDVEWNVYPRALGTISATGVFTAADTTLTGLLLAQRGPLRATIPLRVRHAAGTPTLTIISPQNGATVPFPNPPVAWRVTGAGADTLRVEISLAERPSRGSEGESTDESADDSTSRGVLWTRTVPADQPMLSYPSDAPILQDRTYRIQARLIDGDRELDTAAVTFQHARPARLGYELFQDWTLARQGQRSRDSVRVVATVAADTLAPGLLAQIENTGAVFERVAGPYAQLQVPYPRLPAVAALPDLLSAALPAPGRTFAASDVAVRDDGSPTRTSLRPSSSVPDTVRIGVIEFGFDEARIRSLAPGPVSTSSFRADGSIQGQPGEALHGAATVLALLDSWPTDGPVLDLHLIAVDTDISFLNAIATTQTEYPIDAFSCSISWMNAYDDFDGTSAFSRSLDKRLATRQALAAAAGNFGTSHWEAEVASAGERLRFGNRDTLTVTLQAGQSYDLVMSWSEWGAPRTDLDIEVLDAAGRPLARSNGLRMASLNQQGNGYGLPVERIRGIQVPAADTAAVQIVVPIMKRGEPAPRVELYMNPAPIRSQPEATARSSLAPGLAPTRSVVTATARSGSWRSQGPTNDGRTRPDFSAPGTATVDGRTFRGTSFATPRVAAALALVRAAQPMWTRNDVIRFLQRRASAPDETAAGKSAVDGWGEIDIARLLDALNEL
ncbi:MAG: S8 family serine peptidase [Bacteroidetes bacterium]|nr:S8 family serine peptidase [Bacteroidota bacterium]